MILWISLNMEQEKELDLGIFSNEVYCGHFYLADGGGIPGLYFVGCPLKCRLQQHANDGQ